MLDEHAAEVLAGVNADLAGDPPGPPLVTGSEEAADAAVALMQRTIEQKLYNTDSFASTVWRKDWNTLPHL